MAYSARDELNKYYLRKTGKKYDFDVTLDENINKSGLSGGEADSLRNRTRAYLNAYQQGAAIDNNFQDATDAINRRMENAETLKRQQEKEIDNAAMREASVAGANYERLKKYLPELNVQSGKANLGVGSSAYTDAYSAYVKALNSSAAEATQQKQSLMDNYLITKNNLLSEQEEARRVKNSGEETVRSELNKYLSQADEADDAKDAEVFSAAKKIIDSKYEYSYYSSEDGSGEIDEKTLKNVYAYIEANATSKEKAMELIKNLNSENSHLYSARAKQYAESYTGMTSEKNEEDPEKVREAFIAIGEYFKNAVKNGSVKQSTEDTQANSGISDDASLSNGVKQSTEDTQANSGISDDASLSNKEITSRTSDETRERARAQQARRAALALQEQLKRENKILMANGEDWDGDVMKGREYKISYGDQTFKYKTNSLMGIYNLSDCGKEFQSKVRGGGYQNGTVVKAKNKAGVKYFYILDDMNTDNPRVVRINAGAIGTDKYKFLDKYAIDMESTVK